MENVIQSKEQSQYLSLIVKQISKDRLSRTESESYDYLKMKVDPMGNLEEELVHAWKQAEKQPISDEILLNTIHVNGLSLYKSIRFLKNCLNGLTTR